MEAKTAEQIFNQVVAGEVEYEVVRKSKKFVFIKVGVTTIRVCREVCSSVGEQTFYLSK